MQIIYPSSRCHSFAFFTILGLLALPLRADTELNVPGYRMQWHDEFEGSAVDAGKWEVNEGVNATYRRTSDGRWVEPAWVGDPFEPWTDVISINDERQYYSPRNVTVEDGLLRIRADEEPVNDSVGWYDPGYHKYTSGKLNTADEFQFQHGIVKIRAKQPVGKGLWPALWMLNDPGVPWYWDDEIDIMEGRGSQASVTTSAHHFKVNGNNQFNSGSLNTGVNVQTTLNEYSLEWQPTFLRTSFNGREVFKDTEAIPQGPMFLVMNAAVGGHFDGLPDATTAFPTFFEIDWVRVWQKAATPTDLANGGFEAQQGTNWANWNTLDDGNLAVVSIGALHGERSVFIDQRKDPVTEERGPDLMTNGTGGPWSAWLNESDAGGDLLPGGAIDPSTIPATTDGDRLVLPIHQSAASANANAVVFRQFDGAAVGGRSLTFTGSVTIEEIFPPGTEARAFIRIFDPSFIPTDVAIPVTTGGDFTLRADIPPTDVPIVQVGLETSGPTGSSGRLEATALHLSDDAEGVLGSDNRTGFQQTVAAVPGETVRYGVLAANHPTVPLSNGAEGQGHIQFLDTSMNVLTESMSVLADASAPAAALPHSAETVVPAGAAYARLAIERVTVDPENDAGGGFLADAAFLQSVAATALPLFTSEPSASATVTAGDEVTFPVSVASPTTTTYQWYHNGQKVDTSKDLNFMATPDSGGTWFCVATNEAGPVIGAVTELTVLTPDSDGDGLIDYDEIFLHGTDPAKQDSDGDGMSDFAELMIFLTDPLDAQSVLRIRRFIPDEDGHELTFSSVAGIRYILEGSPDLANWQIVGSSHTASGPVTTISVNPAVMDPPLRFFRIGKAD